MGQLFNFVDKGEREVALRPEMTPTLARMVAARDREFKKPLKWFSVASFFRYEKQQKGRLREFTQLNCDLIGEADPAADAEMIALAIDLMRAFGLTENDFFIRVNDRNVWQGFFAARGVPAERAAEFLQIIDKIERERPEATAQKLGTFGVTREELDTFLARPAAELGGSLGRLEGDLQARGLSQFVVFDPRIVRGLAYYTGVVFEVFDRARESRALAGGGRYDELVGTISDGAVKHPALGFAVGDVTLLDLLRALPHTAAVMEKATIRAFGALDVYVVDRRRGVSTAGARAGRPVARRGPPGGFSARGAEGRQAVSGRGNPGRDARGRGRQRVAADQMEDACHAGGNRDVGG